MSFFLSSSSSSPPPLVYLVEAMQVWFSTIFCPWNCGGSRLELSFCFIFYFFIVAFRKVQPQQGSVAGWSGADCWRVFFPRDGLVVQRRTRPCSRVLWVPSVGVVRREAIFSYSVAAVVLQYVGHWAWVQVVKDDWLFLFGAVWRLSGGWCQWRRRRWDLAVEAPH